jgi:hypothetical protein
MLPGGSPAAVTPDPRAAEATGVLDVLVIRATWGPTPGTDARSELEEGAAFYRRASLGRLDLRFDQTPWLIAYPGETCPTEPTKRSSFGQLGELAQDAARSAGYDPAAYGRLLYVLPSEGCRVGGLGVGREVLLAGTSAFDVHELGHTFGLPHAGAAKCSRGCRVAEYGDPYSPMGHGRQDFTALEKLKLGWIDRVERAATPGTYRIGAVDRPSKLAQALVVRAADGEYWVEHRVESPHLLIRLVVPNAPRHASYLRSIFLAKGDQRYGARGVFSVSADSSGASEAELTFTWSDRTAPTAPRLELPPRLRRGWSWIIRWRASTDSGSGMAGYRVFVDGRLAEQTPRRRALLAPLHVGVHRITVEALDRAGNRSRSSARFAVV